MKNQNNVLVIKGSPRKKGNSAIVADAAADAATGEGAQVETFYLHGMNLNPCMGCDACQKTQESVCVQKDDMHILYPKIRDTMGLIIASPVYWFTMSAQTKIFMDRCYAMGGPDGYDWKGKKVGIIMTYADDDPFKSGAVNAFHTFRDAFSYLGAEIVGFVYGQASKAGEISGNKNILKQARKLGVKLANG